MVSNTTTFEDSDKLENLKRNNNIIDQTERRKGEQTK